MERIFDPQDKVHRIFLNGKLVTFTVQPSRRRRRGGYGFTLSVGLFGVRVRVPPRYHQIELETFLNKHADWLFRQLAKYEERARRIPKRTFEHGESFPLEGRPLPILHLPSERHRPLVELAQGAIRIHSRPLTPMASLKRALERWLRTYAADRFRERIEKRAREMGVDLASWAVRNQKTRWGTCSRKGHLFFNWRLVLAPAEVLDYVVVHELGHLAHANHGAYFWKMVERHCPDYKKRREWLKENGDLLVF